MSELFLEILNMSISASWLVLAVLILRLVLKKAPKWTSVLLWGIVAVRLLCPFSIESSVSLIPDSIGTGELVSEWTDDYIGDIDIHHPDSVYYDAAIGAGREPISDGEGGYYVVAKHDQLGEPSTVENTVVPVLAAVWLIGMIVLILYTVISYLRLRRRVDTAVRYKKNIFQSENVVSPFVLGIINPKIYLPFQLDGQERKHVIAHEWAHIKRKDHLWKPLGFLLLTIHWFNPLLWIAYVLLCRDIELACDEKVIKELGSEQRADYTQALVSCSVNRRMIAACPLAFGEVGVKDRVKSVMNYRKPAFWMVALAVTTCVVAAICFLTNPVAETQTESEENIESNNSIYGNVIAELGDQAAYAFLVMDYDHNVLLTSELIYDEGTEHQASVSCDVFYCVDNEASKLGTLMSDGTAYPITFTNEGIFIASGHKIEKYIISDENTLYLAKGIYEQFDEAGNVAYISTAGDQDGKSTEQEYLDLIHEYEKSQIVHFSYGAEGSVNDYQRMEEVLDAPEPDMDTEEVQRELDRVVSSIGLENAYPWNNTVDFKEDADALIKMASDETGRFEIYGIMSEKYGTYGLLLNDWIGGEQNWNFAYVPWMYSGAPSEEPILETDVKGNYVFSYVCKYEDGVPYWEEYILDCGYDTGHMELLPQEKISDDVATSEDFYKVATSMSASEVEEFALSVKANVLSKDWDALSEKIVYPISIDGVTVNNSSDFLELDFDGKLNQEFIDGINAESCREMFCNYQGIMMGTTGQIWLASVDNGNGTWELKVIGMNGMLKEPEETAPPVEGVPMVDKSKNASIIVTNGNTGEKITVTGAEVYSEEYYFFNDLRKLYGQLDFSVPAVENERVGYQYSMALYDAGGNKLQKITPYKDGLTVDRFFYQYDGTGEGAKASLRLMEYMEYIFTQETSSVGQPFTEVPVNNLPNVTMTMEKYKSWEGDIEISNQSGKELKTWEWYDIQKWEDGEWHRLDQLTDGLWTDTLYRIPAGETAVFPTNWKTWYGDLSAGKYRIVKEIYETIEDEIHTHYLAVEFEIP